MLSILLGAAALASAAPATPATAPAAKPRPVAVATAVAASPDDDKVICHSDPDLGSLFVHKTCLTRRQWADMAADSKRAFDDVARKTGQSLSGN